MNKTKSFIKQFVAAVTGDGAEVKAQKAYRQVSSAINSQIAVLKGESVDKESVLEAAEESMKNALVNGGESITDRNRYVQNLYDAKNHVTRAKDNLDVNQEKLSFLEAQLVALDEEVDA